MQKMIFILIGIFINIFLSLPSYSIQLINYKSYQLVVLSEFKFAIYECSKLDDVDGKKSECLGIYLNQATSFLEMNENKLNNIIFKKIQNQLSTAKELIAYKDWDNFDVLLKNLNLDL
ncbi:MAG: hypothetical protein QE271_13905 [Bacteriovoracaceae bacterium]|nr:hypothetical protein [Bacteriovoracaceae bacterium]